MGNIKNRLNNFQSLPRELIFDNNLSDRARFVYCYMASKPADWDFFLEPMAKELGYGKDTLRKYINELIKGGWLKRGEQDKSNGNKFGAVEYTLYERKQIPCTENADTGKDRDEKNHTLHNRDNKENIDNNKKEIKNNELSNDNSKPTYFLSDKIEKQIAETDKALVYPETFTEECRLLWENLRREPKWRKKSASALQTSLNKLAKYPSDFQIVMMSNSLEKGWQGIEYNNTQEEYEKWKRRQMASINPNDKRELEQLEIAKRIERLYGK